jgi:hypothetical protein
LLKRNSANQILIFGGELKKLASFFWGIKKPVASKDYWLNAIKK